MTVTILHELSHATPGIPAIDIRAPDGCPLFGWVYAKECRADGDINAEDTAYLGAGSNFTAAGYAVRRDGRIRRLENRRKCSDAPSNETSVYAEDELDEDGRNSEEQDLRRRDTQADDATDSFEPTGRCVWPLDDESLDIRLQTCQVKITGLL